MDYGGQDRLTDCQGLGKVENLNKIKLVLQQNHHFNQSEGYSTSNPGLVSERLAKGFATL